MSQQKNISCYNTVVAFQSNWFCCSLLCYAATNSMQ